MYVIVLEVRVIMPTINRRKICPKHSFYDAIENPSCPECKKVSDKTYDKTMRASDRQKIYNDKRWKIVREKAMIRDLMMCCECRRNGISTLGEEVDHVIELQDRIDLAFDLDNLEYLCKPCHSKKTKIEKAKRG